jgi:hypothetical protein
MGIYQQKLWRKQKAGNIRAPFQVKVQKFWMALLGIPKEGFPIPADQKIEIFFAEPAESKNLIGSMFVSLLKCY